MKLISIDEVVDNLTFAFQPIIDLRSKRIYGFESLLRNYNALGYKRIFDLFDEAYKNQNLYNFDLLLREKLLTLFIQIPEFQKRRLFYNIDNRILEMPNFESGNTIRLLKKYNLTNSYFIFEISERLPFHSYDTFSKIIFNYKKQGFKIAIDDFGVGYSSLQLIYASDFDILKLDKFFITNLNNDLRKKLFVEQVVRMTHLLGALIVAEGIETYEELNTCLELDIDLAQGYYICEPFFIDEYSKKISKIREILYSLEFSQSYSQIKKDTIIENLSIEYVPPVKMSYNVEQMLEHLKNNPDFVAFPIINQFEEPVGILNESKIRSKLLHLYSRELWKYKDFSEFLENHLEKTVILESNVDINNFLEILSKNENIGIKSLQVIIVTEHGKYKGVIFPEEILKYLFKQKIITAKDQNPLTNLPGNQSISNFLRKIYNQFGSVSLIYFDITNFKPFNDTFGFEEGDKIILFLGNYLKTFTVQNFYFVGHIGGDDFLVVIKNKNLFHVLKFVLNVQKNFNNYVKKLFSEDNKQTFYYYAKNRYGIEQRFEMPKLSSAILYFRNGEIPLDKISILLAEIKYNSKNHKKYISYKII